MKVYNKSKGQLEKAKKVICPRCKGFGAVINDKVFPNTCFLCKGYGKLWKSESGWTRALYASIAYSQLW
jgi:DnaJ-class molecular chaperone